MDGRLEEIGRLTYNNKLKHPFTAHPKVDPETQEMMFFGYQIMNEPNCPYSVVSSERDIFTQKLNCEFPKVNDALLGRKTKFCYVAEMNGSGLDFGGCLKVDLEVGAVVGRISFGEGCAGGECVFVAKADAQSE